MSAELLAPQNAGNGDGVNVLPETTFDDRFEPRRTSDEASVIGSYSIGSGAVLRLQEYRPFSSEELSEVYHHRAMGYLALADSPDLTQQPHLN